MGISHGASFRWLGFAAALCCLLGCDKWKAEQGARNDKTRASVKQDYARLGFMIPLLDAEGREEKSCDDDQLPKHLKRSSRHCERLALTDEDNIRALFGGSKNTGTRGENTLDWSWMRTLSFQRLGAESEIKDGTPLGIHRSALDALARTNVGVFTRNVTPPGDARQRYRGWLLIFDTSEEKLRCQVQIAADVSKVFDPPVRQLEESEYSESPRPHIQAFWREVDKQLAPISKNFCAD